MSEFEQKVTLQLSIIDTDTKNETAYASSGYQTIADAIGYTLRAMRDDISRMDQLLAEIILLVSDELNRGAATDTLVETAVRIRDGWEEHDAAMKVSDR